MAKKTIRPAVSRGRMTPRTGGYPSICGKLTAKSSTMNGRPDQMASSSNGRKGHINTTKNSA